MKKKNPVINAILYIINNILVKAFQFFLVPIYTSYLSTQEYGVSNLVTSFTMIGGVLITLSIGSATSRYYVECKGNKKEETALFSSLYWFVVLFGILVSALLLLMRKLLTGYIFGDQVYVDIFVLSVAVLWTTGITNVYKTVLTAVQEADTYTVVSVTSFLLRLGLTIYLILFCNMGVYGILYSMIASNLLQIAFSLFDLCRKGRLKLQMDFGMIGKALKYSMPLIPHTLSTTIAQFLSRIFIGNSDSLSAVGIYGLAGQFGNIIDTIQSSVHTAYLPWFFGMKKHSELEAASTVHRVMPAIRSCYNILYLGFVLLSQELIIIIAAREYLDAWKLIPLFVLNYAIKTPYYFFVSFLFYDPKKVRYIFLATLSSSLINIFLSAALIPLMGMYGSIVADVAATIIQIAVIIWLCRGENEQYFKYPDFLKSLINLVIASLVGLVPGFILNTDSFSIPLFLYKAVIWFGFVAIHVFKYKEMIPMVMEKVKKKLKR